MSDENQHWVPKFLIKNFADGDGRVFCLDIHTDRVTKPPPRQAASEKGFNDFQVKGEAISFEDRLEKIETRAAPILRRVNNERQLTTLSAEDRRRVAEFIACVHRNGILGQKYFWVLTIYKKKGSAWPSSGREANPGGPPPLQIIMIEDFGESFRSSSE